MKKIILSVFFLVLLSVPLLSQTSTLVSVGTNGKLLYTPDLKGNIVPDFSGVGYMNSESPIPDIAVVKIVNAVAGDNLSNVQTAINDVAAMALDANGFRGAILFKKGVYNISDTIKITASGIVLRGEGTDTAGTRFIATKPEQHTLFYFSGPLGISRFNSSVKQITDPYVPFGAKQVNVAPGHSFVVGSKVLVHRVPNQLWIDMLTMAQWGWIPSTYDVYYERNVTAVSGNNITLDAPIMDVIDTTYAKGEVLRYSSSRIEKCGIENMRISSTYTSATDENHGWEAVAFKNIINAWAKNLDVYYFGLSAVHIEYGAAWITVDSCKMQDAKSELLGGRRYSFYVDGQRCLVQNCFTKNGRHDYVNGSQTPGPNVFYNCKATVQNADIGPHHRWSTGILFDNVVGNGNFAVQNRTNSGTGHGWSGTQIMFWNCDGNKLIVQDPQGDHTNWAIGCNMNSITNIGDLVTEPLGIIESQGTHIAAIPSLFKAQLNARSLPLPVTILSFDIIAKQTTALLNWTTTSEKDFDYFDVEYSINGRSFSSIGKVAAKGFASNTTNYFFEHNSNVGNNYYRLKMLDKNGSYVYSTIKMLVIENKKFILKNTLVNNKLNIVSKDASTAFMIYNSFGQKMLTGIGSGEMNIDISSLSAGVYFIKTANNEQASFIKQLF